MSYSLISLRATTAKKSHICTWCGHTVLPGSQYMRENSVYDGGFQNFAWHEACRKAIDDSLKGLRCSEIDYTSDNDMPFYELYKLEAA